ncbi:glycosyltransferase [Methylophilales bacterium]|nr:glycosyltransferase [Methylophilales bacterium]
MKYKDSNKDAIVSIVITTKNEQDNIENCLLSILNQTYPRNLMEIIVVDNYSTDKTKKISKKYADIVANIGPERNTQRNYGMLDLSTGKYLVWIDADMILSKRLIENCIAYLSNKNLIALNIPEIILGDDFFSKVRRFERSFYNNTVIDGSRIILRNAFIKSGGFSKNWEHGADDWDLDKELKLIGEIGYIEETEENTGEILNSLKLNINPQYSKNSCIFHNESKMSIWKFIKKKTYYSTDLNAYVKKWGSSDPDIQKQLGLWYRFVFVFVENGKWKRTLKRPDLYFSIVLIRFLTGIGYLFSRLKTIKN